VPPIGRPSIPADQHGKVTAPRLRRALAWHIVRRPGGVVAGATQYGHVRTQIMEGYSGLADSGFVDELAFEELLLVQIESAHADAQCLDKGEHVSGRAATAYRERVSEARQFAGMNINSRGQERQPPAATRTRPSADRRSGSGARGSGRPDPDPHGRHYRALPPTRRYDQCDLTTGQLVGTTHVISQRNSEPLPAIGCVSQWRASATARNWSDLSEHPEYRPCMLSHKMW
jgi:hypothetical protein